MTTRSRLLVAGGGVLVLAGAGAAIASSSGGGHAPPARVAVADRAFAGLRAGAYGAHRGFGLRHRGVPDDLAAAASYLGTTPADLFGQLRSGKTLAQVANATSGKSADGLVAALVAHEKQELADAVKAGRLTQAQADAIAPILQQRFEDLVNGVRPAGPRPGFGFGHRGIADALAAAASYLGTTPADLFGRLRSGKTLAQVANATSGKSADGLVAALVAHEKQELADAVKAGRLTQAQADTITPMLQQRFEDLVNGVRPARAPLGPPPGWSGGPRI